MDEININGFIDVLRNEFSDSQIIISTHEDMISSFMRYKFDKFEYKSSRIPVKKLVDSWWLLSNVNIYNIQREYIYKNSMNYSYHREVNIFCIFDLWWEHNRCNIEIVPPNKPPLKTKPTDNQRV